MRRFAVTILAATSFVVFISTLALWIRSRTWMDTWVHYSVDEAARTTTVWMVRSSGGTICWTNAHKWYSAEALARHLERQRPRGQWYRRSSKGPITYAADHLYERLGFDVHFERKPLPVGEPAADVYLDVVRLPHWLLATLSAVAPAIWFGRRWRTYARTRAGLCFACGYDLRATPGKCPECGTVE